jgi:hypothetical protein
MTYFRISKTLYLSKNLKTYHNSSQNSKSQRYGKPLDVSWLAGGGKDLANSNSGSIGAGECGTYHSCPFEMLCDVVVQPHE